MTINIESPTLVAHSYIISFILELLKKDGMLSDEILLGIINILDGNTTGLSQDSINRRYALISCRRAWV